MKLDILRIKRIQEDLEKLIYKHVDEVNHFKILDDKRSDGYLLSSDDWLDFEVGDNWKAKGMHRWFKTSIRIPVDHEGETLVFRITTGREGQWDACNPQFLFYVNEHLIQGCDVNHREVIVTDHAVADDIIHLSFLAYGGTEGNDLLIKYHLMVLDKDTEALYYDIKIPLESAELIYDKDVYNRLKILKELDPVIDTLDLRSPYSKAYYSSLFMCRDMLKSAFYSKEDDKETVYAIGNTHIDIAWLWTVEETREKVLRSYSTVIELMDRYPDYKFLGSQAILYQFVKEQNPELYERIKEKVKKGQWEVDGGMWLEADCNIPSGESLIRQFQKGEQFFYKEFGVRSSTLWLPDVFGYSAALPQIMRLFDIPYFVTTKLAWNQYNQLPNDMFNWRGLDGSEVFTFMPTTSDYNKMLGNNISFTDTRNTTTYTGILGPNMTLGTYERFQNKDLVDDTLMLYGYGDGGGGPTKEMLENEKRLKFGLPGIPKIKTSFNRDYLDMTFKKLVKEKTMPTWDGELYFEYHRGTLTSNGSVKKWNRKLEILIRKLEILTSINYVEKGIEIPTDGINKVWHTLLLNQFHDIIPGTSIEAVYVVAEKEYLEAYHLVMELLDQALAHHSNFKATVFNDLPFKNTDIVHLSVKDPNLVHVKESLNDVQYVSDNKIIFIGKNVPALGFKSFEFVEGHSVKNKKKSMNTFAFSNEYYSILFNDKGEIRSLIEKNTGYQLIHDISNQLIAYDDRPGNWDNWDVDVFYKRKPYLFEKIDEMYLIESGPVRWTLETHHKMGHSKIVQKIHMYKDLPRIDFKHNIDWQENNLLLRTEFPTTIYQNKATFDIQFGSVERETTNNNSWDTAKFETCAHKWVDLGNNGVGLSLMSDSKYGYSAKQGVLGLSLIKSGKYPNANADIGLHEYTYSIYPHVGRWHTSYTIEEAEKLNSPLTTIASSKKEEIPVDPIVSIVEGDVFIDTIKKSENSAGILIRLHEHKNSFSSVILGVSSKFKNCCEVNLREELVSELKICSGELSLKLKPFEIKTLLLNL